MVIRVGLSVVAVLILATFVVRGTLEREANAPVVEPPEPTAVDSLRGESSDSPAMDIPQDSAAARDPVPLVELPPEQAVWLSYEHSQVEADRLRQFVEQTMASESSSLEKYGEIRAYLDSVPRFPVRPDDPFSDELTRAAWEIEELARTDLRVYDIALEDLIDARSENSREFAWHLIADGCARGNVDEAGSSLLLAHSVSNDPRLHLYLMWNAGVSRDSSAALSMVDDELVRPTAATDEDSMSFAYPALEAVLQGYGSILRSEHDSRRVLREQAGNPEHYIHRYFGSVDDVPDSTHQIAETLLEVAASPELTAEEWGGIAEFFLRSDPDSLPRLCALVSSNYRHYHEIEGMMERYLSAGPGEDAGRTRE